MEAEPPSLLARLFTWRVGEMLWRNTVVSCTVFLLGLGVLYALVDRAGFPEVPAAGIGFLVANSLHYFFGRAWIFRGSDRKLATGYALFLLNASAGLAVDDGALRAAARVHPARLPRRAGDRFGVRGAGGVRPERRAELPPRLAHVSR
jgi:hypothetical protein